MRISTMPNTGEDVCYSGARRRICRPLSGRAGLANRVALSSIPVLPLHLAYGLMVAFLLALGQGIDTKSG